MRGCYGYFLFAAMLVTLSCEKIGDDDESSYDFRDQVLQGKVAGSDWMLRGGRAIQSPTDSTLYRIVLWSSQDTFTLGFNSYCDSFYMPDGDRLIFNLPLEAGLYTLGLDEGHTVTILDNEPLSNYIATDGAVEITSVFTSDSARFISGRMDARVNLNNHVNGKFDSIEVCP